MSLTETQKPRYVTPAALAVALGVSLETIRRWRKQNRIPFKFYGRNTYRFDIDAVRFALESKCDQEGSRA